MKSKFSFLITLLVLVLFAGCAWKPMVKPGNQNGQSTPTLDPSINWQTYENPKYNYSIKYHPDWHKQGENEPPYPAPPAGMSFSRKWEEALEICDFAILAFDIIDNFEGEIDYFREEGDRQESKATIGGIEAIRFTLSNETQLVDSYYFNKGGNTYRMGFNIMRGDHFNLCQSVFEQMVASFRFTD